MDNPPSTLVLTDKHRKCKSRFWQEANENPLVQPTKIPAQRAAQMAGNQQLVEWLRNPEFRDWFYNKNSAKQALEAATEIAISRLVEILECKEVGPKGEVTAASQVNAAKLILEYAGYAPPKQRVIEYRDKGVSEMNEEQLEEFIQESTPKLVKGES